MALGTDIADEVENYKKRCFELEEKRKEDEKGRLILEIELENLKKKNRELEGKISCIQNVVNNEENVKEMTVGLVDEEYEEDKLVQLMIENKVLECEKQKAETELCSWKERVKELESQVCELESHIKAMNENVIKDINMVSRGTKEESCRKVRKRLPFEEYECPNKKMTPSTPGVAPSSFHGVIDISDEDACFDEIPKVEKICNSTKCDALASSRSSDDSLEKTIPVHIDEEHTDDFNVQSLKTRSAKRKRVAKIVTSDDETSDDDNVLICTLVTRNSSRLKTDSEDEIKEGANKRRLTRLRKSESKNRQNKIGFDLNETVRLHGNSLREDEEDNNGVEEGSECEDESLSGFIVDSSESASESASMSGYSCDESEDVLDDYKVTIDKVKENACKGRLKRLSKSQSKSGQNETGFDLNETICLHGNSSNEDEEDKDGVDEGLESEDESLGGFIVDGSESASESASKSGIGCDEPEDILNEYKLTLDKIGRKKDSKKKWNLEGEMLADFGKDTELCMRAVCALYRQQTKDEKASKETIHHNERGFSQPDAFRASELAEFLTDGDPDGDLNKTVEELEQYNWKWIKLCWDLATKYSKQLFKIYQNKEDPYFLPK